MQATVEHGRVIAEHYDPIERRYNDTVTWLAEVLPGGMRTPFEYRYAGGDLYASDGSNMREVFDDSLRSAADLPQFESRRRRLERDEYDDMIAMMQGNDFNTMVVVSDFPPELINATKDLGGYNVLRKQTMLRVLAKTTEGTLKMYSQSLDQSHRASLEAIYKSLNRHAEPGELLGQRIHLNISADEQKVLTDKLMGVYDRELGATTGKTYRAGREEANYINTYDFVCGQSDLVRTYLTTTDRFSGGTAEYNLAAAMLLRYGRAHEHSGVQNIRPVSMPDYGPAISAHAMAMQEMSQAGSMARIQGIGFSGCGATINAMGDFAAMSGQEQYNEAGYGNQSDKEETGPSDKFGPLSFKCTQGHWNKRPPGKLIDKCCVPGCKKGSVGC